MKFKAITYDKYKNIRGYTKGASHIFILHKYFAGAIWNLNLIRELLTKVGFSCLINKADEFEIAVYSSEMKEKIFEVLDNAIKLDLVDLKYV